MRDSTQAKLDRPARGGGQRHATPPGDGAHLRLVPRPAHNLPVQLSSFIGRARESGEIAELLASTRLLTLTGPGGCGKTRLAIRAAEDLAETLADSVWWVELAALADPALLPQTVARGLGLCEQSTRSYLEILIDYLRAKRLLLVLDNCEHLVADCASLANTLLRTCAHLRIMATSREALRIDGEQIFLVPPLALPPSHPRASLPSALLVSPDGGAWQPGSGDKGGWLALSQSEAVELFVARARARSPAFYLTEQNVPAVAHICQRLDGLPLAIELAAARVNVLAVEEIAARLDDGLRLLADGNRMALPRHQTQRAAIQWSYDLLSRPEQELFRSLAIFVGSFALDAVEAVCAGDGVAEHEVLDLLSLLVNKSLVLVHEPPSGREVRYRLLEPVRQYAWKQLRASGAEAALRARYCTWYMVLAERADQELRGPKQAMWLDRLEAEHDNLRAVLQWATEHREAEPIVRLGSVLWEFWSVRGYASEGRQWLDAALAQGPQLPTRLMARVLCAAGWLAFSQGDYARATELLEQSRDQGRAVGDKRGVAEALSFLGLVAFNQSDQVRATALYEESLALYQVVGDKRGMAEALLSLAEMQPFQVDQNQIALVEQGQALFREIGDKRGMAWALNTLGEIAQCQGDLGQAMARYEESIALFREVGSKRHICLLCPNLASIVWQRGDIGRAVALFSEGLALARDLGSKRAIALGLIGLSEVLAATGEPVRASRLLGASEVLLQSTGASLVTTEQIALERSLSAAYARLDPAAFDAAWAEGRRTPPELVIAEALEADIGREIQLAPPPPGPVQGDIRTAGGSCHAELRIYALGPVRVERGDHLLTTSDWGYAQPRDLLFYLLCHGRQTKEQVGLAFWPDAAPAQLRSNFHRTLHHTRQALGHTDWVIHDQAGYRFNRALPYWYDVEAFETHFHAARQSEHTDAPGAIRHLEQAIGLYQGDFLQESVGDWHLSRQRALRERFQEALLLLGELLSAEGRHSEAAEIYRRAIDHDNLLEEAHRALMRCYARQGERGHALRHYKSLIQTLQVEIGADPAPETTALYQQLRRGDAVV